MKKNLFRFLFVLIFLLGLGIMLYPVVSNYIYYLDSTKVIKTYEKEIESMDKKQKDEKIRLANIYNQTLSGNITDPFSEKDKKKAIDDYAHMLKVKEQIGHIEIPQIGEDLPIYAGAVEYNLQRGAGHMENSSLPVGGDSTRCVITAHRGLPSKKLFRSLDKLKKGDVFVVHNLRDKLYYKVFDIEIINPTDINKLRIVKGEDLVTLLTCHPYMINNQRLIVTARRTEPTENFVKRADSIAAFKWWFYLLSFVLAVFIIRFFIKRKKNEESK